MCCEAEDAKAAASKTSPGFLQKMSCEPWILSAEGLDE